MTETENYVASNDATEKSEDAKMKEYEEYLKGNKDLSTSNLPESDLNSMAGKESENDKQLRKFKERISSEPDQVTLIVITYSNIKEWSFSGMQKSSE